MAEVARLYLESDGLNLEAELRVPDSPDGRLAVVCHPHPQRGGDMHSAVVQTAARAFLETGAMVLLFNFRGVGRSQGNFDNGIGEANDVRAAVAYGRAIEGVQQVVLAGYSFGAGQAAAVVDESIAGLVLISIPAKALDAEALSGYAGPVLFVSGDSDHISPREAVQAATGRLANARLTLVPNADHFWWGYEAELIDAIRGFLNTLPVSVP